MSVPLAVNGPLMRGLALNGNLLAAGARFNREATTVPAYRLLANEPPGLCIGKVGLTDGAETLGVLGEPALCEGMREITEYGGWRAYVAAQQAHR